jgi:hypothetical protein
MAMTMEEFLDRLISTGKDAARRDYGKRSDDLGRARLEGALAGFEACRGKPPFEILILLREEQKKTRELRIGMSSPGTAERAAESRAYWHQRCREAEIEWVANCISAALWNEGKTPLIPPTARALKHVATIVGVAPLPA